MKKHNYRIRNWSEYNASLKKRGSLKILISSEAIANWTTDELTGEPGASPTYTDLALETMVTAQAIYGLASSLPLVSRLPDNRPLTARVQYLCYKAC